MKIENWVHAIELTIDRHKAVLDGKYSSYREAVARMAGSNWKYKCPLCEYSEHRCWECPWLINTPHTCYSRNQKYNYDNDKESIERLEEWKEDMIEMESRK